jgi:hypothetical protein
LAAQERAGTPVETDCGLEGVRVVSEEAETAAMACDGAGRALRFMGERGFKPPKPVTIRIAGRFPARYTEAKNPDGSPKYHLEDVYGFYETDTSEVFMKTFAEFSKLPPDSMAMGMAPTRELYASYVAHEVAHHVSLLGYRGQGKMPRVQTEFLSYVAQMETLAPTVREELLRRFKAAGGGSIDSAGQIGELIYSMDPQGFMIKSWVFFKGPEGAKTLDDIMNGRLAEPVTF